MRFAVRAKIDDVVIELARMHQEIAHGVKEISPDLEKRIKANIRPVSADGHQFWAIGCSVSLISRKIRRKREGYCRSICSGNAGTRPTQLVLLLLLF
jgi:predicted small metal-binding protein